MSVSNYDNVKLFLDEPVKLWRLWKL